MKGSQPAHAMYGQPVNAYRQAAQSLAGARLQAGGGEYTGRNRCIADGDTCEGPKAKGTQYCIGHLRKAAKGGDVE
jgi:hypothetical protein